MKEMDEQLPQKPRHSAVQDKRGGARFQPLKHGRLRDRVPSPKRRTSLPWSKLLVQWELNGADL